MLGRTDCASQSDLWGGDGCVSDIVIADLAAGTVGVLPNQALGCTCRSSLGRTAALQNFVGDPVNTATGSYTEAISDALLPGSGVSFDFQRTYNSAAAATSGPLGPGWSEPYAMSLSVSGDTVTFTSEDGAKSVFTKQPDGSFTSSPGVRAQLATISGGYTLTLPDQQVNSFDSAGRLTAMRDRNGRGLTFSHTDGQLTGIKDAGGRSVAVAHDPATGNIGKLALPDGHTVGYGYDSSGRLSTVTYTYDADGRQKTQTANGATITYGYDEAGNPTTTTLPSGNGYTDTRTYDRTGRLASISTADGDSTLASWTLKRDAAGQPTQLDTVRADGSRPPQYYGYDDAGRLASWCTSATEATGCPEGSALVEYTYDKVGNRATMAKKGRTTTYTYDAADELPRATTGLIRQVYTYDGTLQEQHTYDPFGFATATPVEGVTASQNPFGFTGQLNDQVLTGKQDLRARTYDPVTGRLTGRDPIGLRVTDPYVPAYVYAEAAPTRLTDPSGEDPAPGNGWWIGARGSYQHNLALRMAYEQEVAQHGAENVYADLPGANAVWGGKTMTYPTYWSDIAEPDLVVAGGPTPQGAGFAIWDVKPASTYGRSRTASVNKLAGYIQGFHNEFGWPVGAGDPIVPEARPYPKDPKDPNGDEGVMLIFNGAEWNHFGIPDVAPNHRYPDSDIAPLGETDGLIYYKLDKLQREKGRGRWGAALSEFHAQGAEVGSSQVWVCRPTGIPNFASNPLQVIGATGGANTSSLTGRTALSGYGPGPLAAIDPMPFRPVVHSHIESRVTGMSIDFSLRGLARTTVSTVLNGLAMGSPAGMVGRTAVVGAGRVITPVLEELFVLAA
nr:DUF6531 domain-containing protein [Streptomyces coelicoflavus]